MKHLRRVDKQHFKDLAYPHLEFLYNVALRYTGKEYDADDLVQETMHTAYKQFHQLREPSKCRAWLFRILRNHFLKEQRQLLKRPYLDDGGGYLKNVTDESLGSLSKKYEDKATSLIVQQVLDTLAEKFKSPLILYYMEDMTYQEIADYLDIPIGTVMSRLARAKKHMKKAFLQRMGQAPGSRNLLQIVGMLQPGGRYGL